MGSAAAVFGAAAPPALGWEGRPGMMAWGARMQPGCGTHV